MTPALAVTPRRRRYWDERYQAWTVAVLVGEVHIADGDDDLTTILGSCVALCARDRHTGIGGMNHMLLPEGAGRALTQRLIERLLACGARHDDLEFKLFGGSRIIGGMSDIGGDNVASVRAYLAGHGFTIAAADVGGTDARRLRYQPRTGRTMLQRLPLSAVDTEDP